MKKLIWADDLQAALEQKEAGPANKRFTEGYNDCLLRVKSMVHSAPAVELSTLPVTMLLKALGLCRCKECQHYDVELNVRPGCTHFDGLKNAEPDDFCRHAEPYGR